MALITLTSDLGLQDYLAGSVKGQLLQINPDFKLIDISHSVNIFNNSRAAYICRNALKNFSPGTYHLWFLNLFDNKSDYLLIAKHENQIILCPDNSLLTLTIQRTPEEVVRYRIPNATPRNIIEFSKLFGKIIMALEKGAPLSSLGEAATDLEYREPMPIRQSGDNLEVKVIFIDSFENVVLNIHRSTFESIRNGRDFKIVLKANESIETISESYADVPEGEKLAYFNASGYLEIAINKGNASGLLGLQLYSDKVSDTLSYVSSRRLMYQTVIIQFMN